MLLASSQRKIVHQLDETTKQKMRCNAQQESSIGISTTSQRNPAERREQATGGHNEERRARNTLA